MISYFSIIPKQQVVPKMITTYFKGVFLTTDTCWRWTFFSNKVCRAFDGKLIKNSTWCAFYSGDCGFPIDFWFFEKNQWINLWFFSGSSGVAFTEFSFVYIIFFVLQLIMAITLTLWISFHRTCLPNIPNFNLPLLSTTATYGW